MENKNKRQLTEKEILSLTTANCTAENWNLIEVDINFTPNNISNTHFYGKNYIGLCVEKVKLAENFYVNSGIHNATLRNVSIGDNCFINNIGNYINNISIGDNCKIINVNKIDCEEFCTCGEGKTIALLNEASEGNVIIHRELCGDDVELMLKNANNKEWFSNYISNVNNNIEKRKTQQGTIGNNVIIENCGNIINSKISSYTNIMGSLHIENSTLWGCSDAFVEIGNGVICKNSVVTLGSKILNGANINNCFVGEMSLVDDGFSANDSVILVNSHLANGEAVACYCGAFTVSHHKSTLLIGVATSFFNAGSNTNFSNHAYKMGPIHYGILQKGCKTASGTHIILPAKIGQYSVCFGKIANHINSEMFPFSYIFGTTDGKTFVVPGINAFTAGFYRDINKWQKRDKRSEKYKKTNVSYNYFNNETTIQIKQAIELLNQIKKEQVDKDIYTHNNMCINKSALNKGIEYYSILLELKNNDKAQKQWLNLIEKDAKKEFNMGDVEEKTLQNFIKNLK